MLPKLLGCGQMPTRRRMNHGLELAECDGGIGSDLAFLDGLGYGSVGDVDGILHFPISFY